MNSMRTGSVTAVDRQKNKLHQKKINVEFVSKWVHNFMMKKGTMLLQNLYKKKYHSVTQQDDRLALYTD